MTSRSTLTLLEFSRTTRQHDTALVFQDMEIIPPLETSFHRHVSLKIQSLEWTGIIQLAPSASALEF